MAAILTANAKSPSFEGVFRDLEEIGRKPALIAETDGSNLPQVHALNCLRGVFRSSLLSKKAESYLAVNLQLAASSLKSEVSVLSPLPPRRPDNNPGAKLGHP